MSSHRAKSANKNYASLPGVPGRPLLALSSNLSSQVRWILPVLLGLSVWFPFHSHIENEMEDLLDKLLPFMVTFVRGRKPFMRFHEGLVGKEDQSSA